MKRITFLAFVLVGCATGSMVGGAPSASKGVVAVAYPQVLCIGNGKLLLPVKHGIVEYEPSTDTAVKILAFDENYTVERAKHAFTVSEEVKNYDDKVIFINIWKDKDTVVFLYKKEAYRFDYVKKTYEKGLPPGYGEANYSVEVKNRLVKINGVYQQEYSYLYKSKALDPEKPYLTRLEYNVVDETGMRLLDGITSTKNFSIIDENEGRLLLVAKSQNPEYSTDYFEGRIDDDTIILMRYYFSTKGRGFESFLDLEDLMKMRIKNNSVAGFKGDGIIYYTDRDMALEPPLPDLPYYESPYGEEVPPEFYAFQYKIVFRDLIRDKDIIIIDNASDYNIDCSEDYSEGMFWYYTVNPDTKTFDLKSLAYDFKE